MNNSPTEAKGVVDRDRSKAMHKGTLAIKAGLTLAAVVLLYLHVLGKAKLDAIALGLVAFGMLPWCWPYLRTQVKSLEVFGTKIELLETTMIAQRELIRVLLEAADHTLTTFEEGHLRKLASGESGWRGGSFLRGEMIRLCQHGFVEEVHFEAVWKIPDKDVPCDMNALIRITDKGKEHLRLVERIREIASSATTSS